MTNKQKYKIRKEFLFVLAICCLILIFLITLILTGFRLADQDNQVTYGVNFSKPYAESFNLDVGELYLAILDELQVRHIRMPSYWSEIEKEEGNYDFSDLDWYVNQAAEREVELIMVVGQRQPRWPECHFPEWAEDLPVAEQQQKTLEFIRQTVEHYKFQDTIKIWQVENEPLLSVFGECPPPDLDCLEEEVKLVRSIDQSRPILITESGELSTWQRSTRYSDILGFSLYELVWNKYLGFLHYPMTPGHYRRKMDLLSYKVDDVIITELQTEPWSPAGEIKDLALEDQLGQMNISDLQERAEFARQTGASQVYFWGVEWWYWLKLQGRDSLWETSKDFFDNF